MGIWNVNDVYTILTFIIAAVYVGWPSCSERMCIVLVCIWRRFVGGWEEGNFASFRSQ